jgi:hypothetical protein
VRPSAEIHGHLIAGYSRASEQFPESGSLVMFKSLIALVLIALAAAFVSPAVAQQPQGTSVGTLACKMAPSIGLIFGSRQRMACRFTPNGSGPPEEYVGVMAQLVSMSESRQAGSWRGAYLHPPQVLSAERLPALMWVQAARLA